LLASSTLVEVASLPTNKHAERSLDENLVPSMNQRKPSPRGLFSESSIAKSLVQEKDLPENDTIDYIRKLLELLKISDKEILRYQLGKSGEPLVHLIMKRNALHV
jgi:hypothetical protein